MARFIFALSSELMEDGIMIGEQVGLVGQGETLDCLFASSGGYLDLSLW